MSKTAKYNAEAAMNEALNTLRGNLTLRYPNAKVVCLTGERPYADKLALAYGLAKRFAAIERKTLYVECAAIERPSIGDWDRTDGPALMDYLAGKAEPAAIVRHVAPCLDVIPIGASAAGISELVSGDRLGALLDQLNPAYDTIIVDATAMRDAADAAMVARRCDGTLLLAEYHGTDGPEAQRVKQDLERDNINLLGVVMVSPAKPVGKLTELCGRILKGRK